MHSSTVSGVQARVGPVRALWADGRFQRVGPCLLPQAARMLTRSRARAAAQQPAFAADIGSPLEDLSDDVLQRVLDALPFNHVHVTVPLLSKRWRALALQRRGGQGSFLLRRGQAVPLHALQHSRDGWSLLQRKGIMREAAAAGDLEGLQWLHSQEPPGHWTDHLCSEAAAGGHLEVLQWARSQEPPCDWGVDACSKAAAGGHLEVLQWARSQEPPCPWDKTTCSEAARGGHLEVLQWLRAQQPPCPWDRCTRQAANARLHLHVLAWLDSQPPLPTLPMGSDRRLARKMY